MKSNGLILAVLVLAALTGALYWSNHHMPADSSPETSGLVDKLPKVLSLNGADIEKISIHKKGQDEMVFVKNAAGQWQMTAPKPYDANPEALQSMVVELSSLEAERLIDEKNPDLGSYGLAQPAVEVDIAEKDNKTQKLLIGDDSPTGGTTYASVAGDPRVFMVSAYAKSTVNKALNEFRDQRLLRIDTNKVTRVELSTEKQDVEFDRDKDGWQIEKPKSQRADATQVDILLNNLQDAKFDVDAADDQKQAAAAFSSGTPVATAKMTMDSGTQQLQVRKSKDAYYAKSSAIDGFYKVAADLEQAMTKNLGDFQNRRMFDVNMGDPEEGTPPAVDKIEMHDGSKAYSFTRNGRDWLSNGTKMDVGTVMLFLDSIRSLSAVKFADSGFTQPVIDLTVTSNGGKLTQTALIAKNGSDYLAKRGSEATLYELDAQAVQELQQPVAISA